MTWKPNTTISWLLKRILKCKDKLSQMNHWKDVVQTNKYKTTKMYKCMRDDKQHVSWKKMIYGNHSRPRAMSTLCMGLMGRLNTKDILVKIGINTDTKC